ncbi:MAG: hypothetical protein JRG91_11545 [Deltaproteobacteria bacterium]|nr:hypothetical protein [Deltaproteobacteria bacterium]
MTLASLVLIALVTYLIMKRRGRIFLEPEEAAMLAAFSVLAVVQKLTSGSVNLNDHFITPLYFALPVVVGHARGSARGATSAIFGGASICILATAFQPSGQGAALSQVPGQYIVLVVMLALTGAGAGLRYIPKALKPLLTVSWMLVVAIYHPEYLESVASYVTQFTTIALASLGLYFNPFKPVPVPTIHYPTDPSRRT